MTTISEMESRIYLMESEIRDMKGKLVKLKNTPEPCPLEEGKEVRVQLTREAFDKFMKGAVIFSINISVKGEDMIMRADSWAHSEALRLARELSEACGGTD